MWYPPEVTPQPEQQETPAAESIEVENVVSIISIPEKITDVTKEIKMADGNLNVQSTKVIERAIPYRDDCLEVGLEGIASSQRAGYAASQVALDTGLAAAATARDVGLAADATAQRIGLAADGTAQRVGLDAGARAERVGHHTDSSVQRMHIAEMDAINDVGHQVCDASRDGIAATERMGLYNSGVTERNGQSNRESTERYGISNRDATERNGDAVLGAVGRTAERTQEEVERFGLAELGAIRDSERYLYAGMSQNAKDLLLFNANEFQAIKLQACDNADKIMAQSANQFKDILLQAAENAKDAAVTACENVKDLQMQGFQNTAAIQQSAADNASKLAMQIAECCCELKSTVIEKANNTDQLVRQLDNDRTKEALSDAKLRILSLENRVHCDPHHRRD